MTARLERIARQVQDLLETPLTEEEQAEAQSIFEEISAALAGRGVVDQAEVRLAILLKRRRLIGRANPAMDARDPQQFNASVYEVGNALVTDLRAGGRDREAGGDTGSPAGRDDA